MNVGDIFLEKEEENSSVTLFLSKEEGSFSAHLRDFAGNQTALDPSRIKCGIMGITSHRDFIQKIAKVARDQLAVFYYSTVGKAVEVWLFEAAPLASPWIKRAKEFLKLDNIEEAIKQLETAFKIQKQQQGDTIELTTAILQLKKEHFLCHIKKAPSLYLSPEYEASFHQIIKTYGDQENLFSCLSEYLKAVNMFDPSHHYLAVLLHEYQREYIRAIPHYLELALKHKNPLPCLKKAVELVEKASDPFALPHFFEKLDREWLVQLSETSQDPELKQWIFLKDAIRMAFEECLKELSQASPQKQAPTCFICFNVEESDVGKWLEHALIPDLDQMGIKPIFCFRDLGPGKELNNFQGLIRGANQVIIACTPELKRKCDERKKAPTGVAQEVRLAKERYNDPDKYETIFPLYLKGDRESSCPSEFFEPILGTTFTYLDKSTESSVFSYYATVFELFGAMRDIPKEASRQTKERFINKVSQIIKGNYDLEKVEKLRSDRASKNTEILKAAQERASRITQMVNLPEAPVDFTGRKEELEKLHEACRHKSRAAVTGLGGIGKTSLVIKYANDNRSYYQFIHFMPSGSPQLVIEGFLKLADDLHIPKTDKLTDRLLWLKRTLNSLDKEYLLIFDGLDQIESFEEVTKYLPERGHCLLITTRLSQQSKIRKFEEIQLKPFTLKDAVDYLLKVTGSQEEAAVRELAEKLGCLPLALAHAARYIDSQKISIQKYIELFNRYELELFEHKYLDLTKEEQTVLTTWKMSIDALENTHQCTLGKEVLEMLSFLTQAPIPRQLIETWFKISHPDVSDLELGNALRHLCGYSMISSFSKNVYNVHMLVQKVTRYLMQAEKQEKAFKPVLLSLISQMKQLKKKENSIESLVKFWWPHAKSITNEEFFTKIDPMNRIEMLQCVGKYLIQHADFEESNSIFQKVSTELKQLNSLDTGVSLAKSLNYLGRTSYRLGRFEEAEKCHRSALQIRRQCFGTVPNRNIANSLNRLGLALRRLDRFEEAIDCHREAIEIRKKFYDSPNNLFVAISLNDLGLALYMLGRFEEAANCFRKALNIEELCGLKVHPDIGHSLSRLGQVLGALGRFEEAEKYLQNALELRRQIYLTAHPYVASSLNFLGAVMTKQGRFEQALQYHQEALKVCLEVYGTNAHPDVLNSLNYIGLVFDQQGRFNEAEVYHQKALNMAREVYNLNVSLDTAGALTGLGVALEGLNHFDEAKKCHQEALEMRRKIYHSNSHFCLANSLENLGNVVAKLGNFKEAKKFLQEALKIYQDIYETNANPETKLFFKNLKNNILINISFMQSAT